MSRQHLQTILRHAEALAFDQAAATDAELLAQFLARRDGPAFAMLVRRHGPMVWGVCRNLLPADADAEDAFQATFLALVRNGRRVRQGDRLAAWLHGVAVRVALKARRSAAARRRRETTAAATEATAPVSEAAWGDLLAAVHEEVERLPAGLRAAFVLCCLEGVRQHDAAAQLGLKPNTLTARLARARQRVIARLARRGIAPAAAAGAVGVGAATGSAPVPALLAEQATALVHATDSISPAILTLAQGAFDMTTRTKWLAAALLVAAAMTTTIGTAVFSDATGQQPGGPGFPGGATTRSGARGGGATTMSGMAGAFAARWEYKVAQLGWNSGTEKEMNKLGDDGWELVAVTGEGGGNQVFKRSKGRPLPGAATGGGFGGAAGGFGGPAPPEGEAGVATSTDPTAANKSVAAKDAGAHVLPLKHAKAAELQETIASLVNAEYREVGGGTANPFGNAFGGGNRGNRVYVGTRAKIAADARTNSLIVIASEDTLKTIKELLDKLDVPEKAEKTTAKP